MTGHCHAQSAAPCYDSEHELERDGVYCHTCSHASQLPLPDYDRINVEAFEAHFAMHLWHPVLIKDLPQSTWQEH